MNVPGLALGLLAALVYGAADLTGGLASRRSPVLTVVVGSSLVALPLLAAGAAVEGPAPLTVAQAAWAVVIGVAEVVAVASLYLALASGAMSLVSPCVGVVGAGIPLLVGLLLGEAVALSQAVGIAFAFAAIVVVAGSRRGASLSGRTLAWTLLAGLSFAVSFIASSVTQDTTAGGRPWTIALIARGVGLALAAGVAVGSGRRSALARADAPLVVAAGLLDGIAMACLLSAYAAGPLGLTTVVASLYPAVTVALAAVLLRERLGRVEATGVAVAIAAVVLMGVAGAE